MPDWPRHVGGSAWYDAAKTPPASNGLRAVGEADFESMVLGQSGVSFVLFWAPWAPHADAMRKQIAAAPGQPSTRFFVVDAEKSRGLLERHDVRWLPTLLAFRNCLPIAELHGPASEDELWRFVDRAHTPLASSAHKLALNPGYLGGHSVRTGRATGTVSLGGQALHLVEGLAGETLDVHIQFDHAVGDLDLEVLQGTTSVARSTGTLGQEDVRIPDAHGNYVIRVYGYKVAEGDYSLRVRAGKS